MRIQNNTKSQGSLSTPLGVAASGIYPMLLVLFLLALLAASSVPASEPLIVLENQQVALEIDPVFGRFHRVLDKESRIELASKPVLAANFRLDLSFADGKSGVIRGRDQKLSGISRSSNGLTLNWSGPLKDTNGAEHAVAVRLEVKAVGKAFEFRLHLQNHTTGKIRSAGYPMIGGLEQFGSSGKPADGVLWVPMKTPVLKVGLPFAGATFQYPSQTGMSMSFACVESQSAGKSLYFGSHDEIARAKEFCFQELVGGASTNVFAFVRHLPFTPPGGEFDGSTVVLCVMDGDWRDAGAVYRDFFTRTFGLVDAEADSIRNESFFLFTMFMLPEGTINYTFKDIPRWAKVAKDYGINAVEISGWNIGGHDNGLPYYTPDPRLGTWKDFEDGIRACHAMGLKVFIFANYQQTTIETAWYRDELGKYREWNEDGSLILKEGWGYGSVAGRIGYQRLFTRADLGFPQFRKIIADQFEMLAKIGADGVHVDKMFPAFLSFNPDSPMSPDTSTWEGAIQLTKEVMSVCRKHNPNWAMSFECNWDRMLQFGGSSWWVGNQPFTRGVFPENAETQAAKNTYDFLWLNSLVRDGHQIMIAPLKFTRGMEIPEMSAFDEHIRDVKRIRDKLQDTVFLGEVLGTNGVLLAQSPTDGIKFKVFCNRRTGLRACILTNDKMRPQPVSFVGFNAAKSAGVRIHQPGLESYVANGPVALDIPGEQILFIEELASAMPPTLPPSPPTMARVTDEGPVGRLPVFDAKHTIKLEDENILVEVSRDNGSVTRLHDKVGGLDLILEPRLAGSWVFALPLPGKEPWQDIEANWIVGKQQKLSSASVTGGQLRLQWDGPLTNGLGESYDATVSETIQLTDGGVLFQLAIENRTPLKVGETYFPVLGGIQGLGTNRAQLRATEFLHLGTQETVLKADVFHAIRNYSFGGDAPEQLFGYRLPFTDMWLKWQFVPLTLTEPWIGFRSPAFGRSVYAGSHDSSDRPFVAQLRLLPSGASTREDGNWPRAEELRGLPVGTELAFVDCFGGPPGKMYRAAPVFVRFYDGDGKDAQGIYRQWKTASGVPENRIPDGK